MTNRAKRKRLKRWEADGAAVAFINERIQDGVTKFLTWLRLQNPPLNYFEPGDARDAWTATRVADDMRHLEYAKAFMTFNVDRNPKKYGHINCPTCGKLRKATGKCKHATR